MVGLVYPFGDYQTNERSNTMTYQDYCTVPTELLQQIAAEGLDAMPELIRILINSAMRIERQRFLGVGPYERSPERRDHANGYKPKTVSTRVGKINFSVPRVRNSGFYPEALEKGTCSERAVTMALAEMYVQGVSTRKVAAITEELCGYEQPASRLADWLEKNVLQGLTVFAFPSAHRRRIRTTNGLERISREIRRRTRVVSIFPNEASSLRLISAILMEINEEWQTGRSHLAFWKRKTCTRAVSCA